MKLAGQKIEAFLRRPDPRTPTVLVYGPDEGLVRERVERLVRAVLDDPQDPFRLSELSLDAVRSEPGRLADEARALALTGGRRVVRLRQASDQATPACRHLLAQDTDALVLIDAGDLGPGSSLRRLVEGAPNAAALPCYRDHGRDLAGLIDRLLAEHRLAPDADARAYLIEHLGADRGVTRAELARLALYMDTAAADAPAPRRVTLEDVAAVIGDSAALGLDDLVDAAALGDAAQLERCLDRLLREGQPPVRLVRALANHLVRLHRFTLQLEAGESVDRVLGDARPGVHFRRRDKVRAALRRWSPGRVEAMLGTVLEAELGCKTTGRPAELICREAALAVCRAAARA